MKMMTLSDLQDARDWNLEIYKNSWFARRARETAFILANQYDSELTRRTGKE